jgi:serine/threonine protein kinase
MLISTQGHTNDALYVIIAGSARIVETRRSSRKSGEKKEVELGPLFAGNYFGERSLVLDESALANVIAVGDVTCLKLSREEFRENVSASMLHELQADLRARNAERRRRRRLRKRLAKGESVENDEDQVKMTTSFQKRKLSTGDSLVNNKYVMMRVLGHGRYGEVFLCCDYHTGALYAMKVMDRPKKTRMEDIEEIAIMKTLKHANIVDLEEVIDDVKSQKLYIVQEYVKGGELMPMGSTGNPFPEELALRYFRDIVQGIHYLHSKGIVHRDLKPQNLLVADNGTIKLADFGTAIFTEDDAGNDDKVRAGGTPAFMPPELFKIHGSCEIDLKATDVWSLGVTLYCMVVGRPPFHAYDPVELANVIDACDIESIIPEDLAPALQDILLRMLDKDLRSRITIPQLAKHPWVTSMGTKSLQVHKTPRAERKKVILLIDESVTDRDVISRKLQELNFACRLAQSAAEGLALVTEAITGESDLVFDYVLLNYAMTGQTGADVASEVRFIGFLGVLIGISMDPAHKAAFSKGGVDKFLRKPFTGLDLLKVMGDERSDAKNLHRKKLREAITALDGTFNSPQHVCIYPFVGLHILSELYDSTLT